MASGSGANAFFDKTYDEALALTEEAYAYLSAICHGDVSTDSPAEELRLRSEAFRMTTRLMQVVSWLLIQRAVHTGELSAVEVAEDEYYRLGAASVCRDNSQHRHPTIPSTLSDMLDRSLNLYVRVERLDELMHSNVH